MRDFPGSIYREQMHPTVVDEFAHRVALRNHAVDRLERRGDEDVETQRLMHEALAVVHRLHG